MEEFLTLLLAGISVGSVYGLIAIGLNLTFWTTKTMYFGQGSVMMLCAILTASLVGTAVEFYAGAKLIGTTTTSPFSIAWDTTKTANNFYILTSKAYDAAGNVGTSPNVLIIVKN